MSRTLTMLTAARAKKESENIVTCHDENPVIERALTQFLFAFLLMLNIAVYYKLFS